MVTRYTPMDAESGEEQSIMPDPDDGEFVRWEDYQRLQSQLNECRKALAGYEDIRRCSFGVAGYHLNGEVAEWSEFDLPEVTSDG